MEIIVDQRGDGAWASRALDGADMLDLPAFGLACPVRDIYADTMLV